MTPTPPQVEQTEREAFAALRANIVAYGMACSVLGVADVQGNADAKAQARHGAWEAYGAVDKAIAALQASRASMQAQAPRSAEDDKALLKLARFGAAMLRAHRGISPGEIGDIDAGTAQVAAVECGVLEERTVTAPCNPSCECVGLFPIECYFVPDAVGRLRRSFEEQGGKR